MPSSMGSWFCCQEAAALQHPEGSGGERSHRCLPRNRQVLGELPWAPQRHSPLDYNSQKAPRLAVRLSPRCSSLCILGIVVLWGTPTHIRAAAVPLLGREALRGCEGNEHSANYCLNKKNNKNTFMCMSACVKKQNSANIFVYSQREHRSELSDSGVGSACWEGRGEKVKKGLYASIAK